MKKGRPEVALFFAGVFDFAQPPLYSLKKQSLVCFRLRSGTFGLCSITYMGPVSSATLSHLWALVNHVHGAGVFDFAQPPLGFGQSRTWGGCLRLRSDTFGLCSITNMRPVSERSRRHRFNQLSYNPDTCCARI